MTPHVTTLFQVWLEGLTQDRDRIERHLGECESCRNFYTTMTSILTPGSDSSAPRLIPDFALPAKIAAHADRNSRQSARRTFIPSLRWSAAGLAFAVAVFIGIALAKGLIHPSTQYSTSDIVTTYYDAISQQSFSSSLESVVGSRQKDRQ